MDLKSETNRYIFSAQTLINQSSPQSTKLTNVECQAVELAAGLSLSAALTAWFKELSQILKSDVSLKQVLSGEATDMMEIEYLASLRKDRNTWFAALCEIENNVITWQQGFSRSSLKKSSVKGGEGMSLIGIKDVSAESYSLGESAWDTLDIVFKEFKAYVQTVRDRQTEW